MMGVTQGAISKLEATAKIDDERLKEVAEKLGVSSNAIKRFDTEALMLYIENVTSHDHSIGSVVYHINPVENIIELFEKRLKEKDDEILKLKQELGKK